MSDLDFLFDSSRENAAHDHPPHHVLIVDDEPDIHAVTRLSLQNFVFEGGKLEFHEAMSAAQAKQVLEGANVEFSVILLDVVMETNHAGLDFASWVREQPKFNNTRIVLRTGQAGEAPEENVMETYDIHDYKDKTELTQLKLLTLIRSCLRAYRDIKTIERTNEQLTKLIGWSKKLFKQQTPEEFCKLVLDTLVDLLDDDPVDSLLLVNSFQSIDQQIVYGTGTYADRIGERHSDILEKLSQKDSSETQFIVADDELVITVPRSEFQLTFFVENMPQIDTLDKPLIETFLNYVTVGYEYYLEHFERGHS